MIKVLHIMGSADIGGISTVVLNYYQFINRDKIHFDIALTTKKVGQDAQKLKALGAFFFFLPLKSKGVRQYCTALYRLLQENNYDVVHVHESTTCYVALRIAKKAGVPCRIAHAHTTAPFSNLKNELFRISGCILNRYYATNLVACGEMAGERVFGKRAMKSSKAHILLNAVDITVFRYNEAQREQLRKSWEISDEYVIGMVARIDYQKNNVFAINLFADYAQKNPYCKLVLVGSGPDEEKVKDVIEKRQVGDKVIFLGARGDVADIYQALDVLILPSRYEGFPVVAVEAMVSGLPVLLSDRITKELSFGKAVYYLPINDTSEWVKYLTYCKDNKERYERVNEISGKGLDIREAVHQLERLYGLSV